MPTVSKMQQALVDSLLARACEETGVDYAFAFESSPKGRFIKTWRRTPQRWAVWRALRSYGLSYREIADATGADHTSVMHAARAGGWHVPVWNRSRRGSVAVGEPDPVAVVGSA